MSNRKSKKTQKAKGTGAIALNRKARHDFFIEQTFEAGLALEGWEIKSIRAGRINLGDSYVIIHQGEAWLYGCHISPLLSASTHVNPNPTRNRKLLLHRYELDKLIGNVERKGYALTCTALYWNCGRAKAEIGLAKGKKQHDKRETEKNRDWNRDKQRIMRRG